MRRDIQLGIIDRLALLLAVGFVAISILVPFNGVLFWYALNGIALSLIASIMAEIELKNIAKEYEV